MKIDHDLFVQCCKEFKIRNDTGIWRNGAIPECIKKAISQINHLSSDSRVQQIRFLESCIHDLAIDYIAEHL